MTSAPDQHLEIPLVTDLRRTQIVQYAGASGDFNPLHTDEVYAVQVAGYPSVFAHGMLTMGMTGRAVAEVVGEGELLTYGARFIERVWPGDDLTAVIDVGFSADSAEYALAVRTVNQRGSDVLRGYATWRISR